MRKVLDMEPEDVSPDPVAVLESMGQPRNAPVRERIQNLLNQSMVLLSEAVAPRAIVADVTRSEFNDIFAGEGGNASDAPLSLIYPKADRLLLFVATIGSEVTEKITECFTTGDEALGVILDAAASLAADNTAKYIERIIADEKSAGKMNIRQTVLRYSPGYCGWHITGQHKLFAYCAPVEIGVTLRASALMEPLKSVSGVYVVGSPEIHRFVPDFEFCSGCVSRTCLERMPEVR